MSLIAILLYYYQIINSGNYTKEVLRDYAVVESKVAGLSIEEQNQVLYTIDHENKNWIPDKVHYNDMAVGCDSVGLAQIRDCNHPEISFKQATNPIISINFLISNIDKCDTWWKSTCGKYHPRLVE